MSERPLWRLVAGQKTGPYTPEKLRPLMKDGRISPLDRFSYDGTDWRPPAEFPELLRPPAAAVMPSASRPGAVAAGNPPEDDTQAGIDWPSQGHSSGGFTPAADDGIDDAATKKLLAMIHGLIWVGVGVVVILVTLMIVTTVFYKPATGNPAPAAQPPTQAQAQPAAAGKSEAGDAVVSESEKKESALEAGDEPSPQAADAPAADEGVGSEEGAASTDVPPDPKPPMESDKSPAKPRVPELP